MAALNRLRLLRAFKSKDACVLIVLADGKVPDNLTSDLAEGDAIAAKTKREIRIGKLFDRTDIR